MRRWMWGCEIGGMDVDGRGLCGIMPKAVYRDYYIGGL